METVLQSFILLLGEGFGCVSKAIWWGTIVAAKEVRTAGNAKVLENELASVYRYYTLCCQTSILNK